MSVWSDIHRRSNGASIRKEDVDTEISSSLDRISNELDIKITPGGYLPGRHLCMLKVSSMDKQGRTFTNTVHCQIVCLFSIQSPWELLGHTLNIEWNINRIKSAIGDRRFISLEKV